MKTNLLTCILLIATCFVSQNISAYDFSTIILSCTDHGTVVINNNQEFTNDIDEVDINNGAENTFVFKPNANYQLAKVLINGEDVTSSVKNNQLTTMIPAGSKMNVVFSQMTGDVNGDGTVDISDVVKLVNIILGGSTGGEETKTYYWYVGTTIPTDPTNSAENTGLNEWTSLGNNLPTSSIKVTKVDDTYNYHTWYIAAPNAANFVLYNATNAASDEAGWNKSTFNVGSVQYTLWTCKATSYQAVEYLHK